MNCRMTYVPNNWSSIQVSVCNVNFLFFGVGIIIESESSSNKDLTETVDDIWKWAIFAHIFMGYLNWNSLYIRLIWPGDLTNKAT